MSADSQALARARRRERLVLAATPMICAGQLDAPTTQFKPPTTPLAVPTQPSVHVRRANAAMLFLGVAFVGLVLVLAAVVPWLILLGLIT